MAISVGYRFAPDDLFPAQIEDAKCAVRWMRAHADELKLDTDKIGAIGFSAGAHLEVASYPIEYRIAELFSFSVVSSGTLTFMTLKLTEELRQAIRDSDGGPIEVQDDDTHQVYLIVARDNLQKLFDQRLRQELQIGIDQVEAGDVEEWDVEEILAEAHRRHVLRSNS